MFASRWDRVSSRGGGEGPEVGPGTITGECAAPFETEFDASKNSFYIYITIYYAECLLPRRTCAITGFGDRSLEATTRVRLESRSRPWKPSCMTRARYRGSHCSPQGTAEPVQAIGENRLA